MLDMLPILLADLKPPMPFGGGGSMVIGGLFLAAFFVVAGIVVAKKRRKNSLGLILLFAACGLRTSYADIPPRPPQGPPIEFEVRMDSAAAGGPILQVPKNALASTRADVFGSGIQQVVGGAFLSIAIVLGGIWLVRRRPRISRTVTVGAITLVAAGVSFLAGALWAQPRSLQLTSGDLNGSVELGQTRRGVVALQIVAGDKASLLLPPPRRRPGPPLPTR